MLSSLRAQRSNPDKKDWIAASPAAPRNDAMKFFLFALILFFPFQAHAQKACTEMGCTNGLILTADPSFGWPAGIYKITVQTETSKYECQGKLPLKFCGESSSATFGCNSPNITIGESGCMLPAPQHAISDISIKGTPGKVSLRITRNGKPFVTRTLAPVYQTLRPNGPGCGPVCKSATYDLLTAK